MNRIYQGRVAAVQIPNPDDADRKETYWVPLDPDAKSARKRSESELWNHHRLYQDAVNYYTVALASLGVSPESRLTELRFMLGAVWETFERRGERREGLGESLRRSWQMDRTPSLLEAVERFQKPLREHGVTDNEMELAGESLACDLGGDGSIQKGGPEYWPYFCQSGFLRGVTFPRGSEQLAKEHAQMHMAEWVWSAETPDAIARLRDSLVQGQFCNVVPGEAALGDDARAGLFQKALAALRTNGFIDADQELRWAEAVGRLAPTVLPYAGGSINKDALKFRFYAFLVFKHLAPNEEGLGVLKAVYPKPGARRTAKPAVNGGVEERLRSLGDDPIRLVRQKSNIVFRAFTALALWRNGNDSAGLHERSDYRTDIDRGDMHAISWKDFDIAAFKEALKVYNQFRQNRDKREQKLDELAMRLLFMDGENAIANYDGETDIDRAVRARLARLWRECDGKPKQPKTDEGEGVALPRFDGDPRIERLRLIINADLAEAYRLTDGRLTPYGLRRRTMKGWSTVKREWGKVVRKGEVFSEEKRSRLKDTLDELRGGEKREQIGSHKLFEALLADEDAWGIWREPDDALAESIARNGWAPDPLEAFREYCEAREALEDVSRRSLSFTPADARHSRRLFIFTDCCSFGKDRGEYRHDPRELAVTVPVACQDASGRYLPLPRRLVYAAPRLLRDGIRAEDGGYAQDWTQPMMRALFGEGPGTANPQALKEAAVQLMPDFDARGRMRILLNFPLELNQEEVCAKLAKSSLWQGQFHSWKRSNDSHVPFLRWEGEFDGKEPHRWWEKTNSFAVLAADLGTRHAASVALVEASPNRHRTSRAIGEAGGVTWFARFRAGKLLRLPGENVIVNRPPSRLDEPDDASPFREELYGARGRKASPAESKETLEIISELNQLELIEDVSAWEDLRRRFSFPEQNDKLLVALRRTQNWIAECVSWHWKITQPDSEEQLNSVLAKLREQERIPVWRVHAAVGSRDLEELRNEISDYILRLRACVQSHLLAVTRRVLPLRTEMWEWVQHPEKTDCHLLRRKSAPGSIQKALLGGQRGLSVARIEQLSELRRRWQSLNQALRRQLGQKPLTASEMRNDPIPDPCPDILRKLENIRDQRVNQTAHLILAQALGLRLRAPQLPSATRAVLDMHGEYERIPGRAPVDMIVLEDLTRYVSEQGRAKSENSRLMKWCHRAITLKVKLLAEPFGIPVLETPAAYSSRFCSLTGSAGFRAVEVAWEDRNASPWRRLLREFELGRTTGREASVDARRAAELFGKLEAISRSSRPRRTLLAPRAGGPMFVTAVPIRHPAPHESRRVPGDQVLPMQADLNAAANLAFRAIAHPSCASIHHRVRTLRKPGTKTKAETLTTREPRRFGNEGVAIALRHGDSLPKERTPNLFFDEYGVSQSGRARLEGDGENVFPYASGAALWKRVNDREFQWARCDEVNALRLEGASDDVLM